MHRLYSKSEEQLYKRANKLPDYHRYACGVKDCPAALNLAGQVLKRQISWKNHNHDSKVLLSLLEVVAEVNSQLPGEVHTGAQIPSVVDEIEVPFIFTVGKRSGSQFIYTTEEKHLYRMKNKRGSCPALLRMVSDILRQPTNFKGHNHPTSAETTHTINVYLDNLKKKVKSSDASVSDVFAQHIKRYLKYLSIFKKTYF